jgi:hypothetical protein
MNCIFCFKQCIFLGSGQNRESCNEMWQCPGHGAKKRVKLYIHFLSHLPGGCEIENCCPLTEHSMTSIYWKYKNSEFKIDFYHTIDLGEPDRRFSVSKLEESSFYYPMAYEEIMRLPFHPDITPENLEAKIPLWITFS